VVVPDEYDRPVTCGAPPRLALRPGAICGGLLPADGWDGLLMLPDGELFAAGGGEGGRHGAAGAAGELLLPKGRPGVGRLPDGTAGDDLPPDE
jgi:hypothetical protein